ncbi:MAG TPA: methyltransferase domain-containing protein [Segeticoccus sp.]|uniref:class I SAM-dependent methyltransferase n=1 Tax=Segeticoccus sp. TaxID=2706531 RepID=UPI002D80F8B3|nr:methyltransferase domain-containing protein [Segeticoccus sp.]HET8600082.1 methyltransferase domain-containing protein [Segeticoccus sp.]
MSIQDLVTQHYGGNDVSERILAALRAHGVDVEHLAVPDLAPVDNLHAGFAPATEYVLSCLGVGASSRLLDVGCGIGGPARLAAWSRSCRVTGVDLTPAFIGAATELTERVGLADQVSFRVSAGDALPFPDGTFDRAMMIHVGMNIEDKRAVFAETHRVLAPRGRFAVYEQMRTGPGELPFPQPWADDKRSSFVASLQDYLTDLEAAGFTIEESEDRTAAVAGPPGGPADALTPGVVFGEDFVRRIGNNIAATQAGILGAMLVVARA